MGFIIPLGAYVAQGTARLVEWLSTEKLFESVCRQLVAWDQLGEPVRAAG